MNIKTLLGSTLFILALALVYGLAGATDNQPDIDWEQQAKANWRARHGDAQPNLTAEGEKYLEKMTALLQAEKNKERTNEQP